MKIASSFLWLSIVCFLLSACNSQSGPTTALTSDAPKPSISVEPATTITPTPTKIEPTWTKTPSVTVKPSLTAIKPTQTPTPTVTLIPSYPTKQVFLDYIGKGYHSDYEFFLADGLNKYSMVVLYADGQLIIRRDNTYQQKILSSAEIDQLFLQLENLGLFTIDSNQENDPTDKLYDFGSDYEKVAVTDGYEYCIQANRNQVRSLCVYEPYMQYLVPDMQKILKFLDEYQPVEMTPYYPDRILLRVEYGRNTYDPELSEEAISWVESSLSLEYPCASMNCTKILYADGEMAKQLYMLYGDKGYVFTQTDQEYTVYIRVVLPHEEITNVHEQ